MAKTTSIRLGPRPRRRSARQAEHAEPHGFYKALLNSLYDGVYFVDRDRRIMYWNGGAERLTGYPARQVLGRHCADNLLVHVDNAGHQLCLDECPLTHTMADQKSREADVYLQHRLGYRVPVSVRVTPLRNPAGELVGAVEVFSDNRSKKAAEEKAAQLEQMAFLDGLTRIGNRRYLDEKLLQHQRELERHRSPFGVVLMDIDDFKHVNDSHGHNAGDAVLAAVARTLSGCLRASDVLGRWGGEEYLVIGVGLQPENLLQLAERCRALVERSAVTFEGKQLKVTISAGAAMAQCRKTPQWLVGRADAMLYRSKKAGKNRVTV